MKIRSKYMSDFCHDRKSALMFQSVPTGYIPPGNPQGLAQKTCPGGRDLTFESCLGARNSTRTGILWKMKVKLQKNSVDQILTGKNKKTSLIFYLFEVYVFSQWNFSWSMGQFFWFCYHTYLTKDLRCCPCLFIFEVFTELWLSTSTFEQKVMIMFNILSVHWFY